MKKLAMLLSVVMFASVVFAQEGAAPAGDAASAPKKEGKMAKHTGKHKMKHEKTETKTEETKTETK